MFVIVGIFLRYSGGSGHDENQEGIKLIARFIEKRYLCAPIVLRLSIDSMCAECIKQWQSSIVNRQLFDFGTRSGNVIVRREFAPIE